MNAWYIALGVIVLIILVVIVVKLYNRSDTAKSLTLIYMMKNHGRDSFATINVLQDIVHQMLTKDWGIEVTECSLVHEMENRYHAIVTAGGEMHELTIFADITGTVHYRKEN